MTTFYWCVGALWIFAVCTTCLFSRRGGRLETAIMKNGAAYAFLPYLVAIFVSIFTMKGAGHLAASLVYGTTYADVTAIEDVRMDVHQALQQATWQLRQAGCGE